MNREVFWRLPFRVVLATSPGDPRMSFRRASNTEALDRQVSLPGYIGGNLAFSPSVFRRSAANRGC